MGEGKLVHCHSLNGTACAVPRLIQTILEHHQLENGEVTVPEVLVPFCRNKRKLELKPSQQCFCSQGQTIYQARFCGPFLWARSSSFLATAALHQFYPFIEDRFDRHAMCGLQIGLRRFASTKCRLR